MRHHVLVSCNQTIYVNVDIGTITDRWQPNIPVAVSM